MYQGYDFARVVDGDGTEHFLNLGAIVEIAFDRDGAATIDTAATSPDGRGRRYTVAGEEANRLRAALTRREDWLAAPAPGQLPEFRQPPTRPRPL